MELVGTISSIGALLVSAVLAYIAKSAQADFNALRVEIAQGRLEDTLQMRAWINGSFMRASTVEAKIDARMNATELARKELEHRVLALEEESSGNN